MVLLAGISTNAYAGDIDTTTGEIAVGAPDGRVSIEPVPANPKPKQGDVNLGRLNYKEKRFLKNHRVAAKDIKESMNENGYTFKEAVKAEAKAHPAKLHKAKQKIIHRYNTNPRFRSRVNRNVDSWAANHNMSRKEAAQKARNHPWKAANKAANKYRKHRSRH